MAAPWNSRIIIPMKAVSGDVPRGEGWIYELKWDGMRQVAFVTSEGVRLQSSNGKDATASFPELQALAELADSLDGLILDGEAVAFDDGRPSFSAIQRRMHVSDPADARRRANHTPVLFVIFDVLHIDGHDTMALPLHDRRTLLEQIVTPGEHWSLCEQYDDDVDGLLEVVEATGLEGIVAKRRTSVYQPGKRTSEWIKVKPRLRQEFVVGGWLSGQGNRAGGLGSLLLGYFDTAGELHFAGRAGSGLDASSTAEWQNVLVASHECPFVEPPDTPRDRTVTWCVPDQVAEIAFGEWTPGSQIRHPVVLGRRTDKDPSDVVRE